MIFGNRYTHIKRFDFNTCATRKSGESISAVQFHVESPFGIVADSCPEVFGRYKINAEYEVLEQTLRKVIAGICLVSIVDIIELPTVQIHGSDGEAYRCMRHLFADSHLNIPRHLLAFVFIGFQLCANIFEYES